MSLMFSRIFGFFQESRRNLLLKVFQNSNHVGDGIRKELKNMLLPNFFGENDRNRKRVQKIAGIFQFSTWTQIKELFPYLSFVSLFGLRRLGGLAHAHDNWITAITQEQEENVENYSLKKDIQNKMSTWNE